MTTSSQHNFGSISAGQALTTTGDEGNSYFVDQQGIGIFDLSFLLKVLFKWWWMFAAIVILFTAITFYFVSRAVPVYQATAILEIKQSERQILDISQVENVVANQEFVATQIELLQSRRLAESVIHSLNLLNDRDFFDPDDYEEPVTPTEALRMVSSGFRGRLSVNSVGYSRLISVSFQHVNPEKAALIANAVGEQYIQDSLSLKFNATADASKFLQDRLAAVKTSLEVAERDLFNYAAQNNILVIQGASGEDKTGTLDSNDLVTLSADLAKARSERVFAESEYNQALESSFTAEIVSSLAINSLKDDRIKLSSEYVEKLALFKPSFPDMIELKNRIELFEEQIQNQENAIVQSQRDNAKGRYDAAVVKEKDLERRVSQLKNSVVNTREKTIDYGILERQVETERTQYEALLQRLKEVSVADDLGSNLVLVVDTAQVPLYPFKPNKPLILAMAFLLSSFFAFALGVVIELIDNRIKAPGDIREKLGQKALGVIPVMKFRDGDTHVLNYLRDPQSVISEAYASLRANINLSGPNGGPRVLALSSSRSGEGKSTSALGLSLRLAGVGHKVILVDADLRIPTFSVGDVRSVGLSGLLTTESDIKGNILETALDEFDLLPAGPKVINPSDLLSGYRFGEILDYLREAYDYVVIDGPPVLGLADASVISANVDATLFVIEANKMRTPQIKISIDRLIASGANVLGVILTKLSANTGAYKEYYQYSYGKQASDTNARQRKKMQAAKDKRNLSLTDTGS